jgi:hypothetical protein
MSVYTNVLGEISIHLSSLPCCENERYRLRLFITDDQGIKYKAKPIMLNEYGAVLQ